MTSISRLSVIGLMLISINQAVLAEKNPTMAETRRHITQINLKINQLNKTLTTTHHKTALLNQKLADTEKKISINILNAQKLQHTIDMTKQKILSLEQNIAKLDQQLKTQQLLLKQHIRTNYILGQYQPLKWLFHINDKTQMSRLLTYYHYVINSRQHIIQQINKTETQLTEQQNQLHQELSSQEQAQLKLRQQLHQLEQNKYSSKKIVSTLSQEIKTKQQMLVEYQHNRDQLSRVLNTLVQNNIIKTQRPFVYARKKLSKPVQAPAHHIRPLNQGIFIAAHEGATVSAVYSGKVVFSDWLKGYGLLLIIDHGGGFMTLYAHNQSLFKQKGDIVLSKESIATVGHSGGNKQDGLYFEIRKHGKAVPPLAWLN